MENGLIFGFMTRDDVLYFAFGLFIIFCIEILWFFYSCAKSIDKDEQAKLVKDSKSGGISFAKNLKELEDL